MATTSENINIQHLIDAYNNNQDDVETLQRLIRGLNKSKDFRKAAGLLKRYIVAENFAEQPEKLRNTVVKCYRNTNINMAIHEIDQTKYAEALHAISSMIKTFDEAGINVLTNKDDPDKRRGPDKKSDTPIKLRASIFLLTLLQNQKDYLKSVKLLGYKDCIPSYFLAVTVVRNFINSKEYTNNKNVAEQVENLKRFLKETGYADNRKKAILDSVYSNVFYPVSPWREKILSRMKLDDLNKVIQINGLDLLKKYHQEGKGVILVSSHMSTGRALNMILDQMGFKINALEVRDRMGIYGIKQTGNIKVLELGEKVDFPLRQLYLIQKALKKGEIANLSGDGFRGNSGVTVNFLGRKREFKTSYAEIAIKTGAVALPVFGSAHQSGKIHLQIRQPLDAGDENTRHEQRVENMVREYASILEEVWKKRPGDIAWEQIRYFLGLPVIKRKRTGN